MTKNKTIFSKTFIPVLTIALLIIGVYMIFNYHYVLKTLRDNVITAYEEQMINRKNRMESQMVRGFSALNDNGEQISKKIESLVKESGKTLGQIENDVQLNQNILINITDEVLYTLKISGATEVFLILDGLSSYGNPDIRAGVYVRNNEARSYTYDDNNLLFERGIPIISKTLKLPLDIFWQPGFLFNEEEGNEYFFKPLNEAKKGESQDFKDFGYWSFGNIVDEKDTGILTYSVPLIGSDETVFGVIGIGINESFLMRDYNYSERENDESRAYILAKALDEKTFKPYAVKGESYSKASILEKNIELGDEKEGIYYLETNYPSKTEVCLNRRDFRLYNYNTPFASEQWVLIGMQRCDELFSKYYIVKKVLNILFAISVFVCAMGVFLFSRFMSAPIQKMVQTLRVSDPNRPIKLNKLNIMEIDELGEAIENLSFRVAEAYSKISTIIQMSDSGIAVFEYKEKENLVFCSNGFYEIMGMDSLTKTNVYDNAQSFKKEMEKLLDMKNIEKEKIFEISDSNEKKRWLRLICRREQESILGVVTDITLDMREKKKIEHERDYDVLTSLPNRRAFEEMLKELSGCKHSLKKGAMLVWDLDNLKYVNDTYGHRMGDAYLIALAKCLKRFNSKNIISARRSGDEFVSFIFGYDKKEDIEKIINNMWQLIQNTSILLEDKREYKIRISMGKAWYPKDSIDFDTLFHYADFAMYMVKHSKKGTMADFDHETFMENKILLHGQEAFNNLLEQRLVEYMLQPIVWAHDGKVYGYEMLMRSKLEIFKSPLDILRVASSQSKLHEVEVITWFESMKAFAAKVEEGSCGKDVKVFINSIANQIMSEENIKLFVGIYNEYLPNIVCEVTEKEQENELITKEKVNLIRRWGGLVALDDYGCGYNSESVLLRIFPNIVKIDMSIVRGIDKDDKRRRLVGNLSLYAKEREIMLLAEGVETKEELKTLQDLGVHLLQGYYIAPPSYEVTSAREEFINQLQK